MRPLLPHDDRSSCSFRLPELSAYTFVPLLFDNEGGYDCPLPIGSVTIKIDVNYTLARTFIA